MRDWGEWYGEIAYKLRKLGYDVKAHQIGCVNFDFDDTIEIFVDGLSYFKMYYDEWEKV